MATLTALPVPGRLYLNLDKKSTGFDFQLTGEYPRRVEAGDVLATDPSGFPMSAPLPGVVYAPEGTRRLVLRTEGFIAGTSGQGLLSVPDDVDASTFLDGIFQSGLCSFDFPGTPLSSLLQRAFQHERPLIILSRAAVSTAIDWNRILKTRRPEIERFKAWLQPACVALTGKAVEVIEFPTSNANMSNRLYAADIGHRLPPVVSRRFRLDLQTAHNLAAQGIAYLGPATLNAILDFAFHGKAPTARHVALTAHPTVARKIGLQSPRLYRLYNGQPIGDIVDRSLPANRALLVAGAFPDVPEPLELAVAGTDDAADRPQAEAIPANYNLFGPDVLQWVPPSALNRARIELPCTACGACNAICPVNARPFALASAQPTRFRSDLCMQCGLCTHSCPANIALDEMIRVNQNPIKA